MSVEKSFVWMTAAVAVVTCLLLLQPALAQAKKTTSPGVSKPAAVEKVEPKVQAKAMTFREVIKSGGKVMYVLAGMSVLTVALVAYFFIVLRVGQVAPVPLHHEVVEKIKIGSIDDARRACEYRSSPLSAVALAAMDYMHDVPDAEPMLLKDVVEGEGGRQSESIQGQTQYLMDIAVVSPMIGLLGTVFGMLKAFSTVALDVTKDKAVGVASGVSQALITTAFGLIVGIAAMVFFAIFRRKAAKLVSVLETASTDVLTALLSRKTNELSS